MVVIVVWDDCRKIAATVTERESDLHGFEGRERERERVIPENKISEMKILLTTIKIGSRRDQWWWW